MVRSRSAVPRLPAAGPPTAPPPRVLPALDRAPAPPSRRVMVFGAGQEGLARRPDLLAVEEPLEIRLRSPAGSSTLAVTMRTPGSDMELVAGLLLAEGIVDGPDDLVGLTTCAGDEVPGDQRYNVVTATLRGAPRQLGRERALVTSSACGVCGTASIDALLAVGWPSLREGPVVPVSWALSLPGQLRAQQRSFDQTGAVHGAALASAGGSLVVVREDVGRHNAVDKVLGWAMLRRSLPMERGALVVSGRVSFEIVQKALRAGVPVVVAVSGATSLAVELAERSGLTLIGFVRGGRCTVYSGRGRLCHDEPGASAEVPARSDLAGDTVVRDGAEVQPNAGARVHRSTPDSAEVQPNAGARVHRSTPDSAEVRPNAGARVHRSTPDSAEVRPNAARPPDDCANGGAHDPYRLA